MVYWKKFYPIYGQYGHVMDSECHIWFEFWSWVPNVNSLSLNLPQLFQKTFYSFELCMAWPMYVLSKGQIPPAVASFKRRHIPSPILPGRIILISVEFDWNYLKEYFHIFGKLSLPVQRLSNPIFTCLSSSSRSVTFMSSWAFMPVYIIYLATQGTITYSHNLS